VVTKAKVAVIAAIAVQSKLGDLETIEGVSK
jgi:hypothetical protein